MGKFIELYLDAGGKWARKLGSRGRYHFVEMIDWEDHGRDWKKDGAPRYIGELSEVDVLSASEKTMKSALDCCGGADWINERPADMREMYTAEVLFDYGCRAPLDSFEMGSWRQAVRAAKKRSYELEGDPEKLEELMERPVNQIGSTAREFMHGDMMSALDRGVRKGDAAAKIMAKMHGVTPENIDAVEKAGPRPGGFAASIRMGAIPSDDPLAFSMGFMNGVSGSGLDQPGVTREELAEAYIAGHKLGWAVRAGDVPKPDWIA